MIRNDTKNSLVSNIYANYFGFITELFTIANSLIILNNENLLFQYRFDKYFGEWVVGFRKVLFEKTGEAVNLNPHSFRHSALTNYENGTHSSLKYFGQKSLPIKVLKVLANHTSIDTTQSYLPDKDEELLMGALGLIEE